VTCVVSQVVVLKLPVDRRVGPPSAGWTAGAGTSLVYPKLGYSVSDRVSVDCLPAGVGCVGNSEWQELPQLS
jgi:hypothetical protein